MNHHAQLPSPELTPRQKMGRLRAQARAAFVERDSAIDGILLALLTDLSVLMVGPPGTAKSLVARTMGEAITDAKRFFLQLNPTTLPESVFGGVDVKAMAEEGTWHRRYHNYLPGANVVVLDEVFRASAAVLDSLLKACNERLYEDDGGEIKIPMWLLVGSTNTVPDDPHLAAFYDRWALRYHVTPPRSAKQMQRIFDMDREPVVQQAITLADVAAAREEVARVSISSELSDIFGKTWMELQTSGFDVSGRRVRWIKRLMRARAWLADRTEATVDDMDIIADCAWNVPEERTPILRIVINTSCPAAAEAVEALDMAQKSVDEIPAYTGKNEGEVAGAAAGARDKIDKLIADTRAMMEKAAPHEKDRLANIIGELKSCQNAALCRLVEIARAR